MIATFDSLGPFRFRHWLGPSPPRPRQTPQVYTFPGANYESVRLEGIRTQPFSRESIVDQYSIGACRLMYANYCTLIGATPSKVVWQNYDFDMERLRVHVLDCELLEIARRVMICNSLFDGASVDLRVRWTMIFTPV